MDIIAQSHLGVRSREPPCWEDRGIHANIREKVTVMEEAGKIFRLNWILLLLLLLLFVFVFWGFFWF